VHFARAASGDEFDGASLDPKWTVVRPDPANLSVGGGSLTITPEAGDLTTATNTARNLVLQPALGDWTMTSKLTFGARPSAAGQQGGIIAYQDDDNYLKLDLEASSSGLQLKTSLEDSLQSNPAVSDSPIQVNQTLNTTPMDGVLPSDDTIWLRMTKAGYTYTTSYSLDGQSWVPVWSTGATLSNLRVGAFAFNGPATTTGPQVAFDFLHLSTPAAQQIRSLSDYVGFLDLDPRLTRDLQRSLGDALDRVDGGRDACRPLDEFARKVQAEAVGRHPGLTPAQARVLLYAREIETGLGC